MKHLTLDERIQIQECLAQRMNFAQIAEKLGKSRSTISREVKKRRTLLFAKDGNVCVHRHTCRLPEDCRTYRCVKARRCRTTCGLCKLHCDAFEEEVCKKLQRPPYVCNGCEKHGCRLQKWRYVVKDAQGTYEQVLRESREGISLSDTDLQFLKQQVVPLIKQGISVSTACESLAEHMPVCAKTVYSYIDQNIFEINNLDLRQKVRRPLRKKSGPVLKVDRKCHQGRTYEDFLRFMEEHPDLPVCQMDTMEGKKGGNVLLTLLFTNCNLQLMYLRERNTAASVTQVFQHLRGVLLEDFASLFPVLLCDRGPEFSNPTSIEYNLHTGKRDSRVFYCDPMQTNQKSQCERNHELIRYIIPKGNSMDKYTQADIDLVVNHVNSYPRKKWNGLSPIEVFQKVYSSAMLEKLGIKAVPTKQLCLKPELLKK